MNTVRGPLFGLTGLALAGLLLAGCSSSGDNRPASATSASEPSSAASSASTPSSSAPSASASAITPSASVTSPSASASPGATPAVARCTTGDLSITLGPAEGAAGSTYVPIRLVNSSSHPCRTGGFGGVSLVTSPRSEPVGAPADRTGAGNAKPIVLRPGGRAAATLRISQAENYPADKCHPSPTHGLRVYPPNETQSVYLGHDAVACEATGVHLLSLTPYRAIG